MRFRRIEEPTYLERRKTERRLAAWASWITHLDGTHEIKCFTRDHSYMGARIHLASQRELPDRLLFIDARNRLVYEATVVWRAGADVGLQF